MTRPYLPYLKTLRRIPKAIILDMATRKFEMNEYAACLCGWAVRDALGVAINGESPQQASDALIGAGVPGSWEAETNIEARRQFGGTQKEWDRVFYGVIGGTNAYNAYVDASITAAVEEAFTRRVMECVR